jgi:hypothetical protein
MSPSRLLLALFLFLGSKVVSACDLQITIRPHAGEVVFGDPIYIEVTIANPGAESVDALPRLFWGQDRLAFTVHDTKNDVQMVRHGVRSSVPTHFEPAQSVTFYEYLFVPKLRAADREFWRSIRAAERVEIFAVYALRPGVVLVSNRLSVPLRQRDEEEMRLLQEWAMPDKPWSRGPTPTDFGIDFQRSIGREATAEIGAQIGGELGSMLRFCARLQEIYSLPMAARDAKNRELIAWLRKQPDVKRQALTRTARSVVEGNNMSSTSEALQSLIDEEHDRAPE